MASKVSSEVNPNEAKFILEELLRDKRITKADLAEYRVRLRDEAERLYERLKSLGWNEVAVAGATVAAVAAAAVAAPALAGKVKRVMKRASRQVAAARVLQGRYLGLSRQIPENVRKAKFGSDAIKEHGKESIIQLMEEWIASNRSAVEGSPRKSRKGPRKAR
jgi:hypothetical protein